MFGFCFFKKKNRNYLATQTNHLVKGVTQDFRMLDSVERSNDRNVRKNKLKKKKINKNNKIIEDYWE